VKDKDLALGLVRAYNDWHVYSWAGAYPGRFIPCGILPLWDANLMAQEVRRLASIGCHAITFSENPSLLGYPSLHSDSWDPFWAACADVGTVVCLHIGSSSSITMTAPDAPADVSISLVPMNLFMCTADIVFSPVLRKFPDLKVALSEGGIGWIPYLLERLDYVYAHHHAWTGQDFGTKLPSEVFKEHMITCFISDRVGIKIRDEIGVDSITWESDYPHSDSVWPNAPEELEKSLDGLPADDIAKITHLNAMRVFRYDPFAHIKREDATVKALRAQAAAAGVDTTFRPRSRVVEAKTGANSLVRSVN
jgi:predicted TIM-barrel fold metal-dependent hydrolase